MAAVEVFYWEGLKGIPEGKTLEMFYAKLDSGIRNDNSSFLLNFARSRRLRIAGSWYQRPALPRWTRYSNAGGVAKEIDHILVSTRWRILQNCMVSRGPLRPITGLLLLHSSFMSSPESQEDVTTLGFILKN